MGSSRSSHTIVRCALLSALTIVCCSCGGRKPAELPRGYAATSVDSQIARAEQAAREAADNARQARLQYEKLMKQVQDLRADLAHAQLAEQTCSELSARAEKQRKIRNALLAKKAAQATAQPTQAAASATGAGPGPSTTPGSIGMPEYSKSDAPEGYVPPPPAPAPK